MKTLKNILMVMAVAGLLIGGCKEESKPPTAEEIKQEAESGLKEAEKAKKELEKEVESQKSEHPEHPASEPAEKTDSES